MDAIASQVRALYAEADEDGRRKLQADIRDLQTSLDSDWDILIRPCSGVGASSCDIMRNGLTR